MKLLRTTVIIILSLLNFYACLAIESNEGDISESTQKETDDSNNFKSENQFYEKLSKKNLISKLLRI